MLAPLPLLVLLSAACGRCVPDGTVVVSECESTEHWRSVKLIADAKVGSHAVRYQVPAGIAAGVALDHRHAHVDWAAGGELRFWYRFTGSGASSLMVKVLAYPFADGYQATWWVIPRTEADGRWHLASVDLTRPYLRWGRHPDKTTQVLLFRTQTDPGAKLTLDLDQVEVAPRLFTVRAVAVRLTSAGATVTLALENVTARPQRLRLTGTTKPVTFVVQPEKTVTQPVAIPVPAAWRARAKPLDRFEHTLRVAVHGKGFTEKELAVSVTKPLELPPRPRLLVTDKELAALREKARRIPWAKAFFRREKQIADEWLHRAVVLPPRGGQWWHWYACKKDGARLKTLSPTKHRCPVCGTIYSGWPYDDVVLDRDHNRLSRAVRTLGLVYRLTGDRRYAAKAREILSAYADKYTKYPLHNIHGKPAVGGGHVGPQTLDESTWLIPLCQGADMIWDTLSRDEQAHAENGLFRPAAEVIRRHKIGIHNIQCWKNSAVGLVGLLLNDPDLVWDAVKSSHGFEAQIRKGITADGQWFEGAWGYHFYTMSALWALAEAGQRCGLNLYGFEQDGRSYRRLFEAPLDLAMPDLRLPAFNDSGTADVQSAAGLYECALRYYGEARFARVIQGTNRRSLTAFVNGVEPLPQPPAKAHGSRNFPAAGYAVLQHGQGDKAAWLCLKYGPHGGGHGHPDKLNFVSWSRGGILAYDPGTTAYGVPLQKEWYRTTIAHNTLTVDQTSQHPAQGRCLAFATRPGLSAVLAEAGDIYPGVTYRRAVALFAERLILILDEVKATKDHMFDLAYHNAGTWTRTPAGEPVAMPAVAGYEHLKDMKRVKGPLPPVAVTGEVHVGVAVAALPDPEVWAGTGVGRNTSDRVPCVVVRLEGHSARVAWAVGLNGEVPTVTLSPLGNGAAAEAAVGGNTYRLRADAESDTPLVAESNGSRLTADRLR